MRLELGRLAQERDSYKQKCDAMHRVGQQSHNANHQHPAAQSQQSKNNNNRNTSQMADGSTSYYL